MKYLSEHLLDDLYNQTEKNISEAITEWQHLPAVRLLAQPAPGQWSAIQCIEHLNSYGRYYLGAIEKAMADSKDKISVPEFKSGIVGSYFYRLMLPSKDGGIMKKMKSPKEHVPCKECNPAIVLNEFISQLEMIGQFLIKAKSININKAKVGISIAPLIKLKLGDVFLFLVAHINRHMLQAEKALAATCYNIETGIGNKESFINI